MPVLIDKIYKLTYFREIFKYKTMAKSKTSQLNDDLTDDQDTTVEVDEDSSSVNYSIGNLDEIDVGNISEYEEIDEDEEDDSSTTRSTSSRLVDPYAPSDGSGEMDEFLANVNDDEDWPQDYE